MNEKVVGTKKVVKTPSTGAYRLKELEQLNQQN